MKLELHVVCDNNEQSIFVILNKIKRFVEEFEKCESTDVDGLEIVWAKHLGAKAKPSYTNFCGLQVCTCSIDFNYKFLEDLEEE